MRKKCEVNGKILSYIEEGQGAPIVFLHGWGRSGDDFMPLIDSLQGNYRMIAIDLPGHGDSQEPEGDLSLDGLTSTLIELFNQLNIENPILVCHSFGARLAIKLASSGIVTNKLIFTGGAGIEIKPLSFKLKVLHYKFMKILVNTPFYTQYKTDLFANSGSEDYKNASETMKKVMSLAVSTDLSNLLPQIKNEVMLYWGENDGATPYWHAEMMNQKLENSILISKPGLTHYAFLEDANDFNQQVKQYIGGEFNE